MDDLRYMFEPRDSGRLHLAVHRLKTEGDYLSRVSTATDWSVSEVMAVDESGAFADTSCVSFLPWGNIFGIVGANASAPRAGKIAQWMTQEQFFGSGHTLVARPLIVPADSAWRDRADGASKVSVKIPIEALDDLAAHLGGADHTFASAAPNADVTLTISYGRRNPGLSEGAGLLGITKWLADRLKGNFSGVAAASVFREVKSEDPKKKAKRKLEREVVDLIEHEICHVFDLASQQGQVRIDATLQSIDAGAQVHQRELRKAWEASADDTQGAVDKAFGQ
jgi:hypothetical protein